MRADRLVATLLLLQRHGQVTAAQVAEELEISERTARRDLEALGMAGLPVYSQQGRGGGWALAGGGRTDLSGLSADEVRALFLVAGPAASATPDVRAALRKLTRAVPEPLRRAAESAATAVVVDAASWDASWVGPSEQRGRQSADDAALEAGVTRPAPRRPDPPLLGQIQRAVVEGLQVELAYTARQGEESRRVVHPLGLVHKGATWYLLAETSRGRRTFRVDRMRAVQPTGEPVLRPPDFDLAAAWRQVVGEVNQRRLPVRARALVRPARIDVLRWIFGTRLSIGPPTPAGWVEVELRGHHQRSLAAEIAGLGHEVEVVEPPELRAELARIGRELVACYEPPPAAPTTPASAKPDGARRSRRAPGVGPQDKGDLGRRRVPPDVGVGHA